MLRELDGLLSIFDKEIGELKKLTDAGEDDEKDEPSLPSLDKVLEEPKEDKEEDEDDDDDGYSNQELVEGLAKITASVLEQTLKLDATLVAIIKGQSEVLKAVMAKKKLIFDENGEPIGSELHMDEDK